MKFIALVSGGKDSCFNIIHCLNAGHELVAMANLHPKQDRPDEIDSWMFQTVGYKAVEYLAQCADVPLFRAEISEDEEAVVNELVGLFDTIKASNIEFEGVSVGAIGSTYQQVRVDKACAIGSVRSLTYLWQRDQSELLHEIVQSGLDARVIKVAGMGLGERHLGKSLGQIEHELIEMHQSFGLHPCGEGGEYETMVFDAPFFKTRKLAIVPDSEKVVHHSTDDVFYLEFNVETKPKTPSANISEIEGPPLLEPSFADLLEKPPVKNLAISTDSQWPDAVCRPGLGDHHNQHTVWGTFADSFAALSKFFSTEASIESCYHVVVVIKSMQQFAEMNKLYNEVFKHSAKTLGDIPPSRACIQASIPWEIEITVFYTKEADRSGKGIHVQGLSYWAPASIGPYSQCRLVYGISYAAGQIGLIPQSLEVANKTPEGEAVLALQNAVRILNVIHEVRTNWEPVLAVVYITDPKNSRIAQDIWTRFSNLPLIIAVIDVLPRNAMFEWSIQACDLRYFSWFIPDSDEDEEVYSPKPEMIYNSPNGYIMRTGFETRQIRCDQSLPNSQIIISKSCKPTEKSHWIPVRDVFYNGVKVEEVHIGTN